MIPSYLDKILVLVGAVLLPLGGLSTAFLWDDYWLRSSAPNVTGAAGSLLPSLSMATIGFLAFLGGSVGLRNSSSKKWVVLGILTAIAVFVLLFALYSIPLATQSP